MAARSGRRYSKNSSVRPELVDVRASASVSVLPILPGVCISGVAFPKWAKPALHGPCSPGCSDGQHALRGARRLTSVPSTPTRTAGGNARRVGRARADRMVRGSRLSRVQVSYELMTGVRARKPRKADIAAGIRGRPNPNMPSYEEVARQVLGDCADSYLERDAQFLVKGRGPRSASAAVYLVAKR